VPDTGMHVAPYRFVRKPTPDGRTHRQFASERRDLLEWRSARRPTGSSSVNDMASALKTAGIEELSSLRRRVLRQYNLPGMHNDNRITMVDKNILLEMIDKMVTHIENMTEDSPDLKGSPF